MPDFDNTAAAPVAFAFDPWAEVRAVLTGVVDPTTIADEDEVDGVEMATGDLWCRLKVTAAEPWSGRNIAQVEIEAKTIHSTLNTLKFE